MEFPALETYPLKVTELVYAYDITWVKNCPTTDSFARFYVVTVDEFVDYYGDKILDKTFNITYEPSSIPDCGVLRILLQDSTGVWPPVAVFPCKSTITACLIVSMFSGFVRDKNRVREIRRPIGEDKTIDCVL